MIPGYCKRDPRRAGPTWIDSRCFCVHGLEFQTLFSTNYCSTDKVQVVSLE
jgi:hypothetical protein